MIPDEIKNKIKEFFSKNWKGILAVVLAIALGLGSVLFLGKDNVIEQEAEKIILEETGVKVDLTP